MSLCKLFILIHQLDFFLLSYLLLFVFHVPRNDWCDFLPRYFEQILTERGGKQNSTLLNSLTRQSFHYYCNYFHIYIIIFTFPVPKQRNRHRNAFMPPTSIFLPFSFRFVFLIVILIRRRIRCHTESPNNYTPATVLRGREKKTIRLFLLVSFFSSQALSIHRTCFNLIKFFEYSQYMNLNTYTEQKRNKSNLYNRR